MFQHYWASLSRFLYVTFLLMNYCFSCIYRTLIYIVFLFTLNFFKIS